MREPILLAAEQRQRVADVKAHRLAPAGDRDVEARIRVGRDVAHLFGDEIRNRGVVGLLEDVVERLAVRSRYDADISNPEGYRGQAVILAQPPKPTLVREQRALRLFRA